MPTPGKTCRSSPRMQRVQNAQNTALMRQAVAASRGLPPGQSSGALSGLGDALLMEDDVFSELEE